MSEKSLWLSDDAALSSLEDMSTTAGCMDVMCVRRSYANSQHRGVASCIHLRRFLCRILGGGFPRTSRVVSSAEKKVREGRSSSRVSRWNLTVNLPSTTFGNRRENGRNVTSFRGMASVASDMGWL